MKTTIKINPTKNEEGIFSENIIIFHASKSASSDLFLNDDEKEYVKNEFKKDHSYSLMMSDVIELFNHLKIKKTNKI